MLFPYAPESPLTERLRFLSDISIHKDGSEQRVNLRVAPRQEFDFDILVEDDERQVLENLLFGRLSDEWQIPLWAEPMYVASATAGNFSFTVTLAELTEFRNGDALMVMLADGDSQVLENCSVSGSVVSTITTDTALAASYAAGTPVYILRAARILSQPKVSRYAINLTKYSIPFNVTENTVDLADVSAWDTVAGLPLINDPNCIVGTLEDGWTKQIFVTDGQTGIIEPTSFWDRSRKTSAKTFKVKTREKLFQVRQLLHYLKGRQKTFLLPTFGPDLTASGNIVASSVLLNVVNSGYAAWTDSRSHRNIIRVALSDGVVYTKTITDAVELDYDEEQITVDIAWAANYSASDITRIDILDKVRMDSDDITIVHVDSLGQADIGFPVRAVLE